MGVELVVERGDLLVARRPVQADRLGQDAVGFQPQRANAPGRGRGLQFGQQPAPEPQPADLGGDPHPLDVRGRVVAELEHPAPDRLTAEGGEQEQPGGRGHLVVGGGDAPGRVESVLEAARQFGGIGPDRLPGVRVPGVTRDDLDRGGRQQPLDLGHRGHQPVPLPGAERLEEGGGRVVGEPVELGLLGSPAPGQARGPDTPVRLARLDPDQFVPLQGPQQSAQVAGVQVEPLPQPPYVAALGRDLPQQPCLPERPVAGQERVIQRADPLRDGPVEPPDLLDHRLIHSLTLVREPAPAKPQGWNWAYPNGGTAVVLAMTVPEASSQIRRSTERDG